MWTPATRRQHSRAGLRCASDLADDECRTLKPLLPGAPRRGRRRAWPLREIANAIFTMPRAGCTWRLLPDRFPPWRTVWRWFVRLRDSGAFEAINHHLAMLDRERDGPADPGLGLDIVWRLAGGLGAALAVVEGAGERIACHDGAGRRRACAPSASRQTARRGKAARPAAPDRFDLADTRTPGR